MISLIWGDGARGLMIAKTASTLSGFAVSTAWMFTLDVFAIMQTPPPLWYFLGFEIIFNPFISSISSIFFWYFLLADFSHVSEHNATSISLMSMSSWKFFSFGPRLRQLGAEKEGRTAADMILLSLRIVVRAAGISVGLLQCGSYQAGLSLLSLGSELTLWS